MKTFVIAATMCCALLLSACTNQEEIARARIVEAEKTGREAVQAVEGYIKKTKRFPNQIEQAYVRPAALKDIKLMSVDRKAGSVKLTLAFQPVEGKSLVFVRTRNKDKSITWRCTSEDIDPKYLPETCR